MRDFPHLFIYFKKRFIAPTRCNKKRVYACLHILFNRLYYKHQRGGLSGTSLNKSKTMEIVKRETVETPFVKVRKAFVIFNGKRYMVSDNGEECLIFPCDGKFDPILNEVGGGIDITLEEILNNFGSHLWRQSLM